MLRFLVNELHPLRRISQISGHGHKHWPSPSIYSFRMLHEERKAEEVRIPVPWGHIAGKWWGPKDTQPILALHGWLDNAASFDPLIALLPSNMSILAIDAPGHGLSSHYPAAGMYHFTEDIVTLRRIIHYFNWKKISILAHSFGSNNAFMYAAIFPNAVEKYVGLDILRPFQLNINHFISTGGSDIDKFIDISQGKKENTEYTYEQLVELVHKASRGSISKESCKILLTRNSYETEKGSGLYKLNLDPRLKIWFFHSLPHSVLLEMSSRIKCEVLNIKFKQGMHYEKPEYYKQTVDILKSSAKRMEYHEIEGSHHGHLNTPQNVIEVITKFLLA